MSAVSSEVLTVRKTRLGAKNYVINFLGESLGQWSEDRRWNGSAWVPIFMRYDVVDGLSGFNVVQRWVDKDAPEAVVVALQMTTIEDLLKSAYSLTHRIHEAVGYEECNLREQRDLIDSEIIRRTTEQVKEI